MEFLSEVYRTALDGVESKVAKDRPVGQRRGVADAG
jgi:hypothetical protein